MLTVSHELHMLPVVTPVCIHVAVPEPVLFQGSAMHDLSQYANLKLSFSLLLTNVLCIDAELHQLHGDKTSSASVEFDREFLVWLRIKSSPCIHVNYILSQ